VGWLPYYVRRQGLFEIADMPPFTHTLGPLVNVGEGKPQTQVENYLSITNDLIRQLPKVDLFYQALPPELDNMLSFQSNGFKIDVEQTFRLDCQTSVDLIWKGMRDKTRNLIRRAKERLEVTTITDPHEFVHIYLRNLQAQRKRSYYDFGVFPSLYEACASRGQGRIYAAQGEHKSIHAAVFTVWDEACAYFLLCTRNPENADLGAVSLLLWHLIKDAHERKLVFDFDGVTSQSRMRFLVGFGGMLATRFRARRESLRHLLWYLRRTVKDHLLPSRATW
jgi:hypothetical protein